MAHQRDGFRVRVSRPEDAVAVSALLCASYPELMTEGYATDVIERALPLMTRANPKLLGCGTWYVAEAADGGLVGCGGWTVERPGASMAPIDPEIGHIRHFATHPDWVRQGVGRAIFARCVADARAVGVRGFEAYSSLPAERFYCALGFTVIERVLVPLGPDMAFPTVLMAFRLAPSSTRRQRG
jgi:GNAT superfamily N-acetyltransferase